MSLTEYLLLLLLGTGIGAYGTLIGAGGGFLAVPILLIVYHLDVRIAVGTSLLFVFFNALSGTIAYLRQRRVDLRAGIIFTVSAIPGAILGANITSILERSTFRLIFGLLLAGASIYLLKAGATRAQQLPDKGETMKDSTRNPPKGLRLGSALSLAIGFVSSALGTGGGIFHVPAMVILLGFPVHVATATSHFILTFTALVGSATHSALGNVNPEFSIVMGIGALAGAQIGAVISRRTEATRIAKFLALGLLLVAARLIIER